MTPQNAWISVNVPVPIELHSSPMSIKPLLLALPSSTSARKGWFLGGLIQEFREEGSPSTAYPTHWMPLPPLPTPKTMKPQNAVSKTVNKPTYVERQTFRQEPYCYDGKKCDRLRPRWMRSYPKEGDEEDGETLKLEMPAQQWPPGTRVTIEVPCCPECGDPADICIGTGETPSYREWPDCDCGFSWKDWVLNNFS